MRISLLTLFLSRGVLHTWVIHVLKLASLVTWDGGRRQEGCCKPFLKVSFPCWCSAASSSDAGPGAGKKEAILHHERQIKADQASPDWLLSVQNQNQKTLLSLHKKIQRSCGSLGVDYDVFRPDISVDNPAGAEMVKSHGQLPQKNRISGTRRPSVIKLF